jgi:hypothetical protein
MARTKLWFAVLVPLLVLLAGSALAATCPAPVKKAKARPARTARVRAARAKAHGVDPKARELLQQMSTYLGSLDRFKVHTDAVQEVVFPSGLRLDSDRASEVMVERPNHLRADIISAKRNVQIYYDGSNVSLYTPVQKLYAEWPAPGTISQVIERAQSNYRLSLPASDFLFRNPYQVMIAKVTYGAYVGKSLIRGVMTHHLAFRQKDMDWQLWIMEGDKPLPVRLAITDKAAKGSPRFIVTLTDWDTAPQFEPATFTFTPPEDAKRITVAEVKGRAKKLAKR